MRIDHLGLIWKQQKVKRKQMKKDGRWRRKMEILMGEQCFQQLGW
jgi:hypothetical protein